MISNKVATAINNQIQAEFYSAYLYLAMSSYLGSKNFKGFAKWFKVQSQEEVVHAMKFCKFLQDRGGEVALQSIQKPPADFGSPVKAFNQAYDHEKKITELINKLYELAKTQKDYAFEQFLHWFIEEQVEEEASTAEISENLNKIGDKGNAIYMYDAHLGKRKSE